MLKLDLLGPTPTIAATQPSDRRFVDRAIGAEGSGRDVLDATPADAEWPTLVEWLDAHADALDLLRRGAAKPTVGFVLGPGGSENDPALGWDFHRRDFDVLDDAVIGVLLPALNELRSCATILTADARVATSRKDGARVLADATAILGLAGQQSDESIIVSNLVGIRIAQLAFDVIERTLADDPSIFTDDQLVALAHRATSYGGDTASSLAHVRGERIGFHDLIQRTYSDDGRGDGTITPAGLDAWMGMTKFINPYGNTPAHASALDWLRAGISLPISSRRDVLAEYDRLLNLTADQLRRPMREIVAGEDADSQISRRLAEIRASPVLSVKYLPVTAMVSSLNHLGETAEDALGRRDGIVVGIALELYRRRHGEYPATLDALAPVLLPRVPVDRIAGGPLKYRLIDGRPVVYSVGVDRDDDGGRAATSTDKQPAPALAARWLTSSEKSPAVDGD